MSGSELLGGPRGSDNRLDESLRPTRSEKRREHHERMDAKAEARRELCPPRPPAPRTPPPPAAARRRPRRRGPGARGARALGRARDVFGAPGSDPVPGAGVLVREIVRGGGPPAAMMGA